MMFLTLKVHRIGGKDKINEVCELKYTENQYTRKCTASTQKYSNKILNFIYPILSFTKGLNDISRR